MKKKFLAMALCLATVLSFSACGNEKDNTESTQAEESVNKVSSADIEIDPEKVVKELADYKNIQVTIGGDYDVVINIQGDEPFIQPSQLQAIKACFNQEGTQIATLVKPFTAEDGWQALENPNSPKVVINSRMEALYFSRSVIPYCRGAEHDEWLNRHTYYKHIGLYAYTLPTLQAITQLPQSSLELAESLEQLRWLENGYIIKVALTDVETVGIDTPSDLERAEMYLQSNKGVR